MEIMKMLEQKELNRKDKILYQKLKKVNKEKVNLDIIYLMAWTEICGGSKIILEYVNRLSQKGHNITIITYDQKPNWFLINERVNFIQVPIDREIHEYITEADLIVATSWKCIYEAVESNKAPVVFFEQGGAHLFSKSELEEAKIEKLNNRYKMVPFIYTVSEYSRSIIKKEYNVDSKVIPIAIDNTIFYYREKENNNDSIEITAIGPEDFKFKNINEIIQAVTELKVKYSNIHFNWITQKKPEKNKIECVVSPKQNEIGDILRRTDIYICASEYESFGLPILEAMCCGAAVITTDTGGCRDFVKDKANALIIEKHNIADMKEKIELLINNKELRKKIVENGLETAKKYNWDNSTKLVEQYYREISNYEVET